MAEGQKGGGDIEMRQGNSNVVEGRREEGIMR